MTDGLTASDVALIQGNGRNGDGLWGGDGAWWIVLFLIFGWGRNGFGGFGGDSGAAQNYVLASDFATIQRQLSDGFNSIDNALDAQNNGICNLGYTQLQLNNQLSSQIADCCCKTHTNIADLKYTVGSTGAGIQNQIQNCCCDVERQIERGFADTNYAMATQNCATLQAIDKSADRIIDYLSQEKMQNLRDENQALRLAASQQAQNNYIVNTLTDRIHPAPIPAYLTCNPNAALNYSINYGNGCGCGCN